jgi:hypothetical protein
MENIIILKCHNCGTDFSKLKNEFNRQTKKGRKLFFCSMKCSSSYTTKISGKIRKTKNEKDYLSNPNNCLNCKSILSYNDKINIYCSTKCSAIHTQISGGHNQFTSERKLVHSEIMKKHYCSHPKIKKDKQPKIKISKQPKILPNVRIRVCKICKINKLSTKRIICEQCKFEYYSVYRPRCEFKFNVFDYPGKFDLTLLKKLGFYSPVNKNNNLNGISRDHLYTVKDGFDNKIDPEIIKHPANCSLVTHTDNQSKGRFSSITLDELMKRINEWCEVCR